MTLLADTQAANNGADSDSSRADATTRVRDAFLGVFGDHESDPGILAALTEPARLIARSDNELSPDSELGKAVLQTLLRTLDPLP